MENFKRIYVGTFKENSKRAELFRHYEKYLKEMSALMTNNFYQWIDGSYVSNKENPGDIDVLSVLHYQDYESNQKILNENFSSFASRTKYKVDGYVMAEYPIKHKKHIFTKSDLAYWQSLFGSTKMNRAKKQHPKGFIQINIIKNEQSSFIR